MYLCISILLFGKKCTALYKTIQVKERLMLLNITNITFLFVIVAPLTLIICMVCLFVLFLNVLVNN